MGEGIAREAMKDDSKDIQSAYAGLPYSLARLYQLWGEPKTVEGIEERARKIRRTSKIQPERKDYGTNSNQAGGTTT